MSTNNQNDNPMNDVEISGGGFMGNIELPEDAMDDNPTPAEDNPIPTPKEKESKPENPAPTQEAEDDDDSSSKDNEPISDDNGDGDDEDEIDTDSPIFVLNEAFQSDEFELTGEYEDTAEGIVQATKEIIEHKVEKAKEAAIQELFQTNPLLGQFKEHLEKGLSVTSFLHQAKVEDFKSMTLEEDNVELAEKLYRVRLENQGTDPDDIDELVNSAKDTGKLFDKGKSAHQYLIKQQEKEVELALEDERKQIENQQKEVQKTISEVKSVLSTKKLLDKTITAEEAKELEAFALEIDKSGRTAREKAYDNLTSEQWLYLDSIVKAGFKVGGKAPQVNPKSVKFKLKKSGSTVDTGSSKKGTKAKSLSDLGVDNFSDFFK